MTFKTTFTSADTEEYKTWLTFYSKRNRQSPFIIQLEEYGYFDPRPQLNTNVTSLLAVILPFFSLWFLPLSVIFLFIGWGDIYLRLPFDTGKRNECENPEYTVMTFSGNGKFITELWLVWGKKRKHIDLPWALQWVRTSTLLHDNSWFNEVKGKRVDYNHRQYGSYDWLEENKLQEVYTYVDKYDNSTVSATVSVQEREWRPRWFTWTNIFSKASRDLGVNFSEEVGSKKGSWKGGVIGCSWQMIKNETPLECLRRMEKEREF